MATAGPRMVVLVHQQSDIRKELSERFESVGLRVRSHASIQSFLNTLPELVPTCVVVGLPMHRSDNRQFVDALDRIAADAPVVLVTQSAINAPGMRAAARGKFALIDLDSGVEQLLLAVKHAFADHERRSPETWA